MNKGLYKWNGFERTESLGMCRKTVIEKQLVVFVEIIITLFFVVIAGLLLRVISSFDWNIIS